MGENKAQRQGRIAIVGAGLGGLSLARMLRVKGVQATVFDKDRDRSESSVGGSLDMHEESGLYAIKQAGLFEDFQKLARYEDQGMRLLDRRAEVVFEANDGNRPEIDRGQLRDMLLDSIPAEWIRWGHGVQQVHEAAGGGFELVFGDGRREHAEGVVGADGVWSKVRPAVTKVSPQYSGLTFFELEIKNVDREHPDVAQFLSKGLNMAMAENKLISAQRNASGHVRVYAALFVPEDGKTPSGNPTVKARGREDIVKQFAGWNEKLVHLFEVAGEAVRPWPIYRMPIGFRWDHKAGITLIGDAAHVMPPAGDGANLAMQDGVELACALAETGNDEAAVARFEEAMFGRAKEAAAMASAALLEGSSEERIALIKQAMSPA